MTAKFFAFDVETTGLDPENSEIISLAGSLLDVELKEIKSIEVYALPEKGCPPEVAKINGYNEEAWLAKGALSQQDMYDKISAFAEGCYRVVTVGHNVSFDVAFLRALFTAHSSRAMYDKYFSYHSVCTLGSSILFDIAKNGKKEGAYNLGKLCARFGISLGENAHDAKADIRATIEIFRYLTLAIRGDAKVILPKKEERKRPPMLTKVGEHYLFSRGKFEGKSLGEVAEMERGYLMWMLREHTDLEPDTKKAIEAKL